MDLVNELRQYAEDIFSVTGPNPQATMMSLAADEIVALAAQVQEMRGALENIQKCEFAARVEGLVELLASIYDEHSPKGRLKDLVERRLLYMARYADEALTTPDTSDQILARRDAARGSGYVEQIKHLQAQVEELKQKTFARFATEECWIYQGDGSDGLDSLTCPIVVSVRKLYERDAAIWMEAAEVCKTVICEGSSNIDDCIELLRTKADELLKGLEKGHE